jgi:hypothetical protein
MEEGERIPDCNCLIVKSLLESYCVQIKQVFDALLAKCMDAQCK